MGYPGAAGSPGAPQPPWWRQRYRRFAFAHTAVCHTNKGGGRRRQFVARRRVVLPDGREFWVKAGTQSVDGHWALLKRHVSRSAINTGRLRQLRQLVWGHQWRHWLGPGACKFSALGPALRHQRVREAHKARADGSQALRAEARQAAFDLRRQQRLSAAAARPAQREKRAREAALALEDAPPLPPPAPAAPPAAAAAVEPPALPEPPLRRRRLRPLSQATEPATAQAAAQGSGLAAREPRPASSSAPAPPAPRLLPVFPGAALPRPPVATAQEQARAALEAAQQALALALEAARVVGLPAQP